MSRPDFSRFIIHFSKDSDPLGASQHPDYHEEIIGLSARERLYNIVTERRIRATHMPWTRLTAVCFWPSILQHAREYSAFGIGLSKEYVFNQGGSPAIYLPPHLFQAQSEHTGQDNYPFAREVWAMCTPFAPEYASEDYLEASNWTRGRLDFSHEREWRIPRHLTFSNDDVEFLIVANHTDIEAAPVGVRNAIPENKWIVMSNYEMIEAIWPQHLLGT